MRHCQSATDPPPRKGTTIASSSSPHRVFLIAALSVVGALTAALVVVKRLDEDNRFCVSCHLHEDLSRVTHATPPSTLAAAHFHASADARVGVITAKARSVAPPTRCFTCHSGEGVVGWSQVTLLSAWDASRWVLGDRHEPRSMRLPITNDACLKCHAADVRGTMSEVETSNYHDLSRHNSVSMACVSCHEVHDRAEPNQLFLRKATVQARCATCHRDLESS
ncbi:MAG: cytochrome c3 family protein [Candidatus Eisenbacteria bacterium]